MDRLVQFTLKSLKDYLDNEVVCLLFLGDMRSAFLLDILKENNIRILVPKKRHSLKEVYNYVDYLESQLSIEIDEIDCEFPDVDTDEKKFILKCLRNKIFPHMKEKKYNTLISPIDLEEHLSIPTGITIISPLSDVPEPEIWKYMKSKETSYRKTLHSSSTNTSYSKQQEKSNDEEVLERLKSLGYL